MRLPFDGNYPVTQKFGNKLILNGVDIYGQWGMKGHNGIDYKTPTGTTILAPHSGTIKEARLDNAGYGWYVRLENDIEGSVLGHNKSLLVKVGDVVTEGQKLSISDNTGNSTGAHLHWGYYRFPRKNNNGYSGYIDQTPFLVNNSIENMIRDFLISKGYTSPETHLDVVKVLYESDIKLKSGQVINKEDCQKEKEAITKKAGEIAASVKQIYEAELSQQIINFTNRETLAVKTAIIETDKKWEEQTKDYAQIKDSGEYKFAQFLFKLLHLKKAGE